MTNYCRFHCIESADERNIEAFSLGISGRAFTSVREWTDVDMKVESGDERQSKCVAILNHEPTDATPDTIDVILPGSTSQGGSRRHWWGQSQAPECDGSFGLGG